MACFNNTPLITGVQYPQPCDCCTNPDCAGTINSVCVYYNGPALPCTDIQTGDTMEAALQKIEEQICAEQGEYATYNVYCLAPVTTEQQFVEKISEGYCTFLNNFNTFVNTTFVNYQASVTAQLNAIRNPAITCAYASVTNVDTLTTVLNKYCTAMTTTWNYVNLAGVDWTGGGCFVVPTPPANVSAAFGLVMTKLCALSAAIVPLPTFNNIGSCLPSPGAADTLVSTIDKIKTRLCATPVFDINALTWDCVVKPSTTTTNLQAAFQTVLDQLNDYIKNKLTFSADFTVTATDPMDPCAGLDVALTTPVVGTDRYVASNNADLSPGTLIAKLQAGTNITLDDLTTPGKVIVNASTADTYKVKADISDSSPDYLIDKIAGKSNPIDGLNISDTYNALTKNVDLTPGINWTVFINKMLDNIQADPALYSKLCSIVSGCSTTTTTTTTTGPSNFVIAAQYGINITNVTGSGAGLPGTFLFPIGTGTSQTKTYAGLTAQSFLVSISGTYTIPFGDFNVSLEVGGILVDCVTVLRTNLPSSHTLVLPAPPSLGQEVRISINSGSC